MNQVINRRSIIAAAPAVAAGVTAMVVAGSGGDVPAAPMLEQQGPSESSKPGPVRAALVSIDEQLERLPPERAERLRTIIHMLLDEALAMMKRGESYAAIQAYSEEYAARVTRVSRGTAAVTV